DYLRCLLPRHCFQRESGDQADALIVSADFPRGSSAFILRTSRFCICQSPSRVQKLPVSEVRMKRISILVGVLILISLWGWMAKRDPSTPSATKAAVVSYTTVPMSYMDAASALAEDDFAKAKESLTRLAEESRGDLQARARHAAEAADIGAMREAFKTL